MPKVKQPKEHSTTPAGQKTGKLVLQNGAFLSELNLLISAPDLSRDLYQAVNAFLEITVHILKFCIVNLTNKESQVFDSTKDVREREALGNMKQDNIILVNSSIYCKHSIENVIQYFLNTGNYFKPF